jgi:hypothetical protein
LRARLARQPAGRCLAEHGHGLAEIVVGAVGESATKGVGGVPAVPAAVTDGADPEIGEEARREP